MRCESYTEAVVDRARGTSLGAGTAAAVDAHLDNCEICRARFARERRLSAALQALARSSVHAAAPVHLEQRLLEAFAREHRLQPRPSLGRLRFAAALAVLGVTAAGAAMLVQGPARSTTVSPAAPEIGHATPSHGLQRTDTAATSASRGAASDGRTQRGSRSRSARVQPTVGAATSMDDFVPLPAAIGLPALESGRIVRLDLPVASLPAYGIEIEPGVGQSSVQADFLVGQDGQPRAIRLVQAEEHARSRQ